MKEKIKKPRREILEPIDIYFKEHPVTVYVVPAIKVVLGGAWMIIFFVSVSIFWVYLRVFFFGFRDEDDESTYQRIFERETKLRLSLFFIIFFVTTGFLAWLPETVDYLVSGTFIAGVFFLFRLLVQMWQNEKSKLRRIVQRIQGKKEKQD